MSIKPGRNPSNILWVLAILLLFLPAALGQSAKPLLAFQSIEIRASQPGDQVVTLGILPDGHIRFRNTTLRKIIAAAYNVDDALVTGGPVWLDSDRFDIVAQAPSTASQADRLAMLQALLADRFKLAVRHDKKVNLVYILTVGKNGPKLQPAANSVLKNCAPTTGDPKQAHLLCHSFSMADLADLLPRVAPNYLELPVVDRTGLAGVYDFQVDWMGRRPFDAAMESAAAGAPRDPLAVSIFDAVAKLGLSLEKHDDPKDTIVVERAERIPAKPTFAGTAATELKPEQASSIDRFVTEEIGRQHIPGVAVGIYRRGEILLAKGYGLANVELNVPVKPQTIFQSGSVGKQFVSAAVMLLVEEGKIGLDDSIVKYFPNAPASWKPILVKNLLSHTSGLAEYETAERTGPKGPFYLRLDFSEDELVEKIEALPIEFAPGEKWDYRNTNYVLLGIMIHKITGKPYADYLQERIFKPWYMTATRLISEKDIIPNRSAGYEWSGGKLRNQDWVSPTFNSTADGTLYFNVLDLAKWDEALYGTSLLQQSSLDRLWTVFPLNNGQPNPAGYGFGWRISAQNGHKVIGHGGAWQGFTCFIQRYVDDGLTVVVLANLAGADTGEIAQKVAGLVNPALMPPPPKAHKEIAVNPKVFAGYVGRYQLAPDFIITITQAGDHLFAQATGQPIFELFAESERDFFLKAVDAQITFITDAHGRATELVLHQRDDKHAKRIE
ncbi:MAG: TIGR03435 family protein [Candidatus Angelobacter sp.]